MKDKIYTELNRNKPDREVLSKAYREMGVPEKSKKHSARTIIKWASACACSILIIIVAVIVVSQSGLFSKYEADSGMNQNKQEGMDANNGFSSPSDDGVPATIGFDYRRVASTDDGIRYITNECVEVKLYTLQAPLGQAGEKITITALGVIGILAEDGDKTLIEFSYSGIDYKLVITSTERNVINGILSDIKIL